MRIVLAIAGVALVLVVIYDVLRTTMARGQGVLADAVGGLLWRSLLRRTRGTSEWLLIQGGLFVLLLAILIWVVLLWAGWALVFQGAENAVVNGTTKAPADWHTRIYFAGFVVSTLGLGDYVPQGWLWRTAANIATFNGLFVLTFSITYVIPVLQAAIERRQLALQISTLGASPQEILMTTCEGKDCAAFEQHLVGLLPQIALQSQRNRIYPVLHYFHGKQRQEGLAPSIAALDGALFIIEHAMRDPGVKPGVWRPVRAAIAELLDTLDDTRLIDDPEKAPPPPELDALRQADIPLKDQPAIDAALRQEEERRKRLLAFVQGEGWSWDDVS